MLGYLGVSIIHHSHMDYRIFNMPCNLFGMHMHTGDFSL